MKFKDRYTPSEKVQKNFTKPSKADPSQQAATDINNIMKKYAKTGVITHVTTAIPVFGDVTQFGSYMECLDHVSHAQQLFSELPSKVRERFQNNPAAFMEFMGNSENTEEAIKLGLAIQPPSKGVPDDKLTPPTP